MQLTRAADYAVRVMINLAAVPSGTKITVTELAQNAGIPEKFLSKVLQQLVRSRLVASQRGGHGGYELAVPGDKISLLRVVEAVEGPITLNLCLHAPEICPRDSWCAAHLVWEQAQAALKTVLDQATISKLAEDSAARLVALQAQRITSPVPPGEDAGEPAAVAAIPGSDGPWN